MCIAIIENILIYMLRNLLRGIQVFYSMVSFFSLY